MRLLKKWFLAQHIGPIAWTIRSEYYYNRNLNEYQRNLAAPGSEWGTQDWVGEVCAALVDVDAGGGEEETMPG